MFPAGRTPILILRIVRGKPAITCDPVQVVGEERVELSRLTAQGPKPCVSAIPPLAHQLYGTRPANSTTGTYNNFYIF